MTHLLANAVDTFCWVLVVLILGVWAFRGYVRSDDRFGLVRRYIISAALVLLILGILRIDSPVKYLLFIFPCVILSFLWLPSIVSTIVRPLTGAFDGGNEEAEPKPFYFTAEGHRRKGEYDQAIAEVRKQLELFPGDYEGYVKLASIQMEDLKNLSAAQATLNEFLEIPGRAPNEMFGALHLLADWQLQFGRSARAAGETLQRIVHLYPNTPFEHAAKQRLAHLVTADEANRVRHESKFTVEPGRRDIGISNAPAPESAPVDPGTRATELVKQLQSHPFDTEAREKLAILYAEEFQRVDMAADQLEQLIALPTEPPKHVAHWLNLLATLHIKHAQNLEAAQSALRRIAERFPGGALATMATTRLASLNAELKASQITAPKTLGTYERNMGLKRSLSLLILMFGVGAGFAASFPPVAELPSRPDLPDPLVMMDGKPVTTKKEWIKQRRPELKALFQHYMYGWFPASVKVTGKVTYTDRNFFDGKATLKLATISLGKAPCPEVHLLMVIPNHRDKPAPLFLGMNFSGNHTVVADTNVPLPTAWMPPKMAHVVNNRATEAGRGTQIDTWALEQSVDRGYAVATYYCGDVEMDRTNATGGVRELIHVPKAADDWGTIAAWAWGMQRVVDYLIRDLDIDRQRIALVGHSRFGKATILAGAFDERIALVIPLQAGCGGTAPSRGKIGESVKRINTAFPHWFNGVFKEFNDQVDRLPFDQNCLIALCAPRPVLLGGATEDTWTNPTGAFDMLRAASGAYHLLGAEGLAATAMPPTNVLIDSNLGYFIRPGKHSMTRTDWKYFLDFADKHIAESNR